MFIQLNVLVPVGRNVDDIFMCFISSIYKIQSILYFREVLASTSYVFLAYTSVYILPTALF